ncbi:MAG: hypothetical protein COX57_05915 [Alphaproteobacteria bacterium CG_4_10_14_0_2_um_filter_63_37]|nr:MAG: hypothetical protein AUJ55_07025 [Proteobacteria bacterium CG1_02_64_396]PJA24851.1 MAG: hypothetical protein COX57_05915 [Alphaproteobacteria bacterium CG_4_10_14_0_2_um_filter_63_37]
MPIQNPEYLIDKLRRSPLFGALDVAALRLIVDRAEEVYFNLGEVLLEEETFGDDFHILIKGKVDVTLMVGGQELLIAEIEAVDVVGEIGALSQQARTATVRAASDVVVALRVSRGLLHDAGKIDKHFEKRLEEYHGNRLVTSFLLRTPPFDQLPAVLITDEVQPQTRVRHLKAGQSFIEAGTVGGDFYILQSGYMKVVLDGQTISYLRSGSVFGEMALFSPDRLRTVDVVAASRCIVMEMPGSLGTELARQHPGFQKYIDDLVALRKKNAQSGPCSLPSHQVDALVSSGILQASRILAIDLDRCVHCDHCVDACADRHGISRLVRSGRRIGSTMIPSACWICDDPVCLLCSYDAIRRTPTGEVQVQDNCTGCTGCAVRCPYDAIFMEELLESEGGPGQVAVKCDGCFGFSNAACVMNCHVEAIRWVEPESHFQVNLGTRL